MESTDDDVDVNEVRLVGRVAAAAQRRELPSGDELVTARLVIGRAQVVTLPSGRRAPSVDTIDLVAWSAGARRLLGRWAEGDRVVVEGALRRRFYRAGAGAVSRVEVEVRSGRRVRRATA